MRHSSFGNIVTLLSAKSAHIITRIIIDLRSAEIRNSDQDGQQCQLTVLRGKMTARLEQVAFKGENGRLVRRSREN